MVNIGKNNGIYFCVDKSLVVAQFDGISTFRTVYLTLSAPVITVKGLPQVEFKR